MQGLRGMQKAIDGLADSYLDWRHQIWTSAAAAEPAAAIADPRGLAMALERSIIATAHEVHRHNPQCLVQGHWMVAGRISHTFALRLHKANLPAQTAACS